MLWALMLIACVGLGDTSTNDLKTLSTVIGDTADTSAITYTDTDTETTPTAPIDSASPDILEPMLTVATPQCQTTSIHEELTLTALDLGIKAVHIGLEASSCTTFEVTYQITGFDVLLQYNQSATGTNCTDCFWSLDTELSVPEPGTYTVHSLGLSEEVVVL